MINTAVILARGLGTRMRKESDTTLTETQARAAASGHKALMPIGEHRLIDYSLSSLADAGIEHAILVVAPEHEEFADHFTQIAPTRLSIDFAVQEEALGTANAVASAEALVGERSFIMANGDNLYPQGAIGALAEESTNALVGFERGALVTESNIPEDRIAAFALVEHENNVLRDILEKPSAEVVEKAGPDALVSMNLFAFTPEIFTACREITPSARGEYEIVDAVRALDDVKVVRFAGGVLDLSRRDDIAGVEARLADVQVRL